MPTRKRATSSIGFCVADRPMRVSLAAGEGLEPLQRQRQVRAALAAGQRVDLVHDHRARGGEHVAAGLGAQQDVQRLRRRHHDVRRLAAHARALGLRRVAGAHEGADLDLRQAEGCAVPRGCRPAAPRGCCGCRWTAPSAARRRRCGSHPAGRCRRCRPAPVRRWRPGKPPASCPSRWVRRSARGARRRSPATPRACAGVGVAKVRPNQFSTAG